MRDVNVKWFNRSGLGPDPVAMHGAPVSFSAGLTGIGPGESPVLDTSALQNGYRTPYWIDEIRMQVFMDSLAPATAPDPYKTDGFATLMMSYAMSFQFRASRFSMSQVPIPMGLYAPNYNGRALGQIYSNGQGRFGCDVRWLLPKPLFMAPGDVILATASRSASAGASGNVGNADANVNVTYVGRALPPGAKHPVTRNVPWASFYTHTLSDSYSRTGVLGQNPFQNPFTKPVMVHRLVGKPADASAEGNGDFTTGGMLPTLLSNRRWVSCYIEDSQGYKVTRAFTSVGSIFDTERQAWTFNRTLGPRQQLDMQFQSNDAVSVGPTVFSVGLLGYREEEG